MTVTKGKQVPISEQSVVLEDGSRVSTLVGKDGKLMETLFEEITTLYDSFERACEKFGDCAFLGERTGPAPGKLVSYSVRSI